MVGLVFVVTGLIAVSVVDVDGDPTTTNVATVVLSGEAPVVAEDDARRSPPAPDGPMRAGTSTRFARAVGRWFGEGRHRWMARVRPIRGP
jgi:hypothetical protein